MWDALDTLYNAVHRGCTCKIEGYNQYGVFNQSIQDWYDEYKPWSIVIIVIFGLFIGAVATAAFTILGLIFPLV